MLNSPRKLARERRDLPAAREQRRDHIEEGKRPSTRATRWEQCRQTGVADSRGETSTPHRTEPIWHQPMNPQCCCPKGKLPALSRVLEIIQISDVQVATRRRRFVICTGLHREGGFGECLLDDFCYCSGLGRSDQPTKPNRPATVQDSGTESSTAGILLYEDRQAL